MLQLVADAARSESSYEIIFLLLPIKTIPKRSHNASSMKDKGRERTVIYWSPPNEKEVLKQRQGLTIVAPLF